MGAVGPEWKEVEWQGLERKVSSGPQRIHWVDNGVTPITRQRGGVDLGQGGPEATMSSRLALASLTHTVNCCVGKTDVAAACQAARGRETRGMGPSVSCEVGGRARRREYTRPEVLEGAWVEACAGSGAARTWRKEMSRAGGLTAEPPWLGD